LASSLSRYSFLVGYPLSNEPLYLMIANITIVLPVEEFHEARCIHKRLEKV
jgi:hypothetical protein